MSDIYPVLVDLLLNIIDGDDAMLYLFSLVCVAWCNKLKQFRGYRNFLLPEYSGYFFHKFYKGISYSLKSSPPISTKHININDNYIFDVVCPREKNRYIDAGIIHHKRYDGKDCYLLIIKERTFKDFLETGNSFTSAFDCDLVTISKSQAIVEAFGGKFKNGKYIEPVDIILPHIFYLNDVDQERYDYRFEWRECDD